MVITDIDLGPGISGLELADRLRACRPGLPVVFITGRVASLCGRVLGPCEAVLLKPFEGDALMRLLEGLGPA